MLGSNLARRIISQFPKLYFLVNRINSAVMREVFKESTQGDLLKFWETFELAMLPDENYHHFGDRKDGGYVLAAPINSDTEVISIGLGDNLSFDFAISPFVDHIHMWDHTIETPHEIPVNATYYAKGLAEKSLENLMSLEDILRVVRPENRIILKIDIEGAEWEVLNKLNRNVLNKVDQIIIEFHNLFEVLRNRDKFNRTLDVLQMLSDSFLTVNVNPNNWGNAQILHGVIFPDVIEVTYLRKNLTKLNTLNTFSSKGYPNNPDQPRLFLENFKSVFR